MVRSSPAIVVCVRSGSAVKSIRAAGSRVSRPEVAGLPGPITIASDVSQLLLGSLIVVQSPAASAGACFGPRWRSATTKRDVHSQSLL